jgi:hypothetical protein
MHAHKLPVRFLHWIVDSRFCRDAARHKGSMLWKQNFALFFFSFWAKKQKQNKNNYSGLWKYSISSQKRPKINQNRNMNPCCKLLLKSLSDIGFWLPRGWRLRLAHVRIPEVDRSRASRRSQISALVAHPDRLGSIRWINFGRLLRTKFIKFTECQIIPIYA